MSSSAAWVALDYAALAGIALVLTAYLAASGLLLVRWLGRSGSSPAGGPRVSPLLLLAGALPPLAIAGVELRGAVQVGAVGEPWLLPTALLLVGGMAAGGALAARAWRLGPAAAVGRRWRIATLAVLFAVGVAASMVWVQTHHTRLFEGGDGPAYDLLGANLAQGFGLTFWSEGSALVGRNPHEPTMHREPFYPLYVAAVYRLFGTGSWDAVALSQTLLMGFLAVATYLAVRQALGESAGILGGLFAGASPDHGDLARQLMTEPLFVPLFVSAVAFGLAAVRTGRARWYVLAGAGLALSALVRVFVSVFFLPFALVWLVFALRTGGRAAARGVALAGLAFGLVLAPWVARNTAEFGVPFVAGRYGTQFLPRALKTTAPAEQWLKWSKAALYAATAPLGELVYPIRNFQYGEEVWANEVWDFHVNDANATYRQTLGGCEQEFVQLEACQTRVAVGMALSHLPQYAAQTVFEFVKFNFYPFPSTLAAYRNLLVWIALVTGVGLAVRRRLAAPALWLFLLLATYVGVSVQVDAWERHAMPLLPLYYGFSAVGLLGLVERLAAVVSGRWSAVRSEWSVVRSRRSVRSAD